MTEADIKAFWANVDKRGPDECWLWTASINHNGYGHAHLKPRKTYRAHRLSWMINKGEIPEGLHVLHTCDVRNCVNPAHLFLGNNTDNQRDMIAKGRSRKARGSDHPHAKLEESQVAEIKRRMANGEMPRPLAKEFGMSRTVIYQIGRGDKWKHILPELTEITRKKIARKPLLTIDDKEEIMHLWKHSKLSLREIGAKFDRSPAFVSVFCNSFREVRLAANAHLSNPNA